MSITSTCAPPRSAFVRLKSTSCDIHNLVVLVNFIDEITATEA